MVFILSNCGKLKKVNAVRLAQAIEEIDTTKELELGAFHTLQFDKLTMKSLRKPKFFIDKNEYIRPFIMRLLSRNEIKKDTLDSLKK